MGEARARRLARLAGRPWERDAPPAPEPLPWYMDPMCPALPRRRGGPEVSAAPPSGTMPPPTTEVGRTAASDRPAVVLDAATMDPRDRELLREILRRRDDARVVRVNADRLPGGRRPIDLLLLAAVLGLNGGQSAKEE